MRAPGQCVETQLRLSSAAFQPAGVAAPPDPAAGEGYRRFDAPDTAGVSFAVRADLPGSDPYGLLVSTDGQRTWTPNIALSYPIFAGVDGLSISPAFNTNGTVVASGQCTNTLYRSSDGGARWAPWAPPIAFTAESNGQRDVVMMDMDSRAQRPVTTAAANDENPAWSPAWAEQMLVRGRRLLAEQAGLIRDEELRRAFCDNIAHHRRLTNMG